MKRTPFHAAVMLSVILPAIPKVVEGQGQLPA
jgi:hypothetical protein